MIGDYDVDPGIHPHDEVPIFKVLIRFYEIVVHITWVMGYM